MICDIAAAVTAAVSDDTAELAEEGTGDDTAADDDDDDEGTVTDEGFGIRKPLTVSAWFRLGLLLLLVLLLLLLLTEMALLLVELADVLAFDEVSVCAFSVLFPDPKDPGAELELDI